MAIEGLRCRVSADELREHCHRKARFHRSEARNAESRYDDTEKAMRALNEGLRQLSDTLGFDYKAFVPAGDHPLDNASRFALVHSLLARGFAFIARHLFEDDYALMPAQLVWLGFFDEWHPDDEPTSYEDDDDEEDEDDYAAAAPEGQPTPAVQTPPPPPPPSPPQPPAQPAAPAATPQGGTPPESTPGAQSV
jgi:hypothetical protein